MRKVSSQTTYFSMNGGKKASKAKKWLLSILGSLAVVISAVFCVVNVMKNNTTQPTEEKRGSLTASQSFYYDASNNFFTDSAGNKHYISTRNGEDLIESIQELTTGDTFALYLSNDYGYSPNSIYFSNGVDLYKNMILSTISGEVWLNINTVAFYPCTKNGSTCEYIEFNDASLRDFWADGKVLIEDYDDVLIDCYVYNSSFYGLKLYQYEENYYNTNDCYFYLYGCSYNSKVVDTHYETTEYVDTTFIETTQGEVYFTQNCGIYSHNSTAIVANSIYFGWDGIDWKNSGVSAGSFDNITMEAATIKIYSGTFNEFSYNSIYNLMIYGGTFNSKENPTSFMIVNSGNLIIQGGTFVDKSAS